MTTTQERVTVPVEYDYSQLLKNAGQEGLPGDVSQVYH